MMMLLSLTTLMLPAISASSSCNKVTLDFILLDGDATAAALEDDIATDLAKVGITVNARYALVTA